MLSNRFDRLRSRFRPAFLEQLEHRRVLVDNLAGIDFGPYIAAGEAPGGGSNPLTATEFQQRLQTLMARTGAQRLRTFGVDADLRSAGQIAHGLGKLAYIGAWIDKNNTPAGEAANRQQMQTLANLVNNDQVDVAIVGSEAVRRGDVTPEEMVDYLNDFRALLDPAHRYIPVTTAETEEQLLDHPEIIAAVDLVYANIYPFHDGVSINGAIAKLDEQYQALVDAAGGKRVEISETGWPSAGDSTGNAVPSPANAARYFGEFVDWAAEEKVAFTYFEGYDEPWKTGEGSFGPHWGILQANGSPKAGIAAVLDNGPANHAPALSTAGSPKLATIAEDATKTAGTLLKYLVGAAITDPDGAPAVKGIAVVSAPGKWEFTLDGGDSWKAMGTVSETSARLLPVHAGSRVRFQPSKDFSGVVRLQFRAWDQTQGTAGGTFNLTNQLGGARAFSTAKETASLTVTPVNDKPIVKLSGTVNYVHNTAAIVIASGATVTDVDNTNFAKGRLRVRYTAGATSSNRLGIGGPFSVDVNNNVKLNGTTIGKRASNGFATNELIVTFTSGATKSIVQQLVRSITFKTVNGSAGLRRLAFTVSDGDGGLSAEAIKTVNVT